MSAEIPTPVDEEQPKGVPIIPMAMPIYPHGYVPPWDRHPPPPMRPRKEKAKRKAKRKAQKQARRANRT